MLLLEIPNQYIPAHCMIFAQAKPYKETLKPTLSSLFNLPVRIIT